MAIWYLGTDKHDLVTVFAVSTLYSVGQLVRRITATYAANHVWRCTTGGTSAGTEPSWNTTNNGTTTSGSAVFTCVTGQSTYAWSAPARDIQTIGSRLASGDTLVVSSAHSETTTSATILNGVSATEGPIRVVCVNAAGSTPPVAADQTTGAVIYFTTSMVIDNRAPTYFYGIEFKCDGTIQLGSNSSKKLTFDNCVLNLNGSGSTHRITLGGGANPQRWDNVTVKTSHASQSITVAFHGLLEWVGGSLYSGGTIPTTLFSTISSEPFTCICRGVDFSALGSGKNFYATGQTETGFLLLERCLVDSSVTFLNTTSIGNRGDKVEVVACFNGTSVVDGRYTYNGTVTLDRSTYRDSGSQDADGHYSMKCVTTANAGKYAAPVELYPLDVLVTVGSSPGGAQTLVVNLSSSGSLNDDDVWAEIAYPGTSGSTRASFISTRVAERGTPAALSSSTDTWTSGAGTNMKISQAFTPLHTGRARVTVYCAKPSTTIYVDAAATIS